MLDSFFLGTSTSTAQNQIVELDGSIQIGTSVTAGPTPGSIQWTGSDLKGWNGYFGFPLPGLPQPGLKLIMMVINIRLFELGTGNGWPKT